MRLAYYAGASTAAAAACLLKAFHQRPNFYSAAVYLSESNACLLILTNLLLMLSCSFIYGLQRALYGPLRPIEIEQLSEKAWYAVLDTLLAMPSFREDVGGWLLVMFVLLLAGKVWGWIAEGRVDILEQQPPANPRLFHARLATSLTLSVLFDFYMLDYCVESVIANPRPGMMVIFTFEFAILSIFSMFTMSRYLLSLVEAVVLKKQTQQAIEIRKAEIRAERAEARQSETADAGPAPPSSPIEEPIEVDEMEVDVPGWEEKRRYLFALEVLTDFLKLLIYVFFFSISITFNGLPMHIMRDVYMTFVSFSKRITDYVAYRKATSHMNARYPDATTDEIRGDACIVCREDMVAWDVPNPLPPQQPDGQQRPNIPTPNARRDEGLRAKKLPCGHILHLRCLKAWLERQQVCPTCRRPVVPAQPARDGVAGVAGPNAQAPAGQPPRPAGRQNPFRLFNLGPFRLGFLHLPDDHIENIVQHINQANANDANAAAAPADQGAQAQAPGSASGQHVHDGRGQSGVTSAIPSSVQGQQDPLNIQLMRLEQRIIQEAHNLGLAQQQLVTLRSMEGELARLRAQEMPSQLPVGVSNIQRPFSISPFQTLHSPQNFPSTPYSSDTFHGRSVQQFSNGHASLPSGLVLPEGWTAMPLYRSGGNLTNSLSEVGTHSIPHRGIPHHTGDREEGTITSSVEAQPASAPSRSISSQYEGPVDDTGSPLFTPAQPVATSSPPEPQSQLNEAQRSRENKGWDFGDDTRSGIMPSNSRTTNPETKETRTEASTGAGHTGKGKARAVEVEDAQDSEA